MNDKKRGPKKISPRRLFIDFDFVYFAWGSKFPFNYRNGDFEVCYAELKGRLKIVLKGTLSLSLPLLKTLLFFKSSLCFTHVFFLPLSLSVSVSVSLSLSKGGYRILARGGQDL